MNKIVLALALLAGSASSTLYSTRTEANKYAFEQFKAEYGRSYETSEEEESRFGIFVDNLKLADARNVAEQGSASHGITKFMDVSAAEFKRTHLNYVPVQDLNRTYADVEPLPTGVDALIDWTGVLTTPVKDQVKNPSATPQLLISFFLSFFNL